MARSTRGCSLFPLIPSGLVLLILLPPFLLGLPLARSDSPVGSFLATYIPENVYSVLFSQDYKPTSWRGGAAGNDKQQEDLFYHLGGNGPWIPKRRDVLEHGVEPPEGCKVEQVHMMSRHAERYPTKNAGLRHLSLLERMDESTGSLHSAFDFLANWTYFTSWSNPAFEQLTSTGQYAGTLEAFSTGVKLRTRYQHLIPGYPNSTRFWSASSSRDVATAGYFADGFFGRDWESSQLAKLSIIPETNDLGGDTLTPGDTCLAYLWDKVDGHDKGYGVLATWQEAYLRPIIRQLHNANSSMEYTPVDLYSMMEMCGFEMLVRDGISPWCHIFDHDTWLNFEYARDLLHFYRAGPGNHYSRAMGMLWLNATMKLLDQGPDAGTLFFSFVHDGDIVPMLSALGYPRGYDSDLDGRMRADLLDIERAYRTTDVSPMGGRIIFERLSCDTPDGQQAFVRLNINDGIVPIGDAAYGPGNSTALPDFKAYLLGRAQLAGDFRQVCGLDDDAPGEITFLHQ